MKSVLSSVRILFPAHTLGALVAGAALQLACGPSLESTEQPGLAQSSSSIIGGEPSAPDADPAVVALVMTDWLGNYDSFCTGTLIGPKTVLTAAHCVDEVSDLRIAFGARVDRPTQIIQIKSQQRHPDYDPYGRRAGNDLGLIELATPAQGVQPHTFNTESLTKDWVGLEVRHVGFGLTSAMDNSSGNEKLTVSYKVRAVTPVEIESGASGRQTCAGDSGGPAFVVPPGSTDEVLVAVVSWGDQRCRKEGWDSRVDVGAPWIQATMAKWESAAPCDAGAGCGQAADGGDDAGEPGSPADAGESTADAGADADAGVTE